MAMHLSLPSPSRCAGTPPTGHGAATRPATHLEGVDLDTPLLVVEDEAMIAWMVETMLEEMGFRSIAIAATGDQAIALAGSTPPGLIVTDINLGPGLDGIAAAAAIRAERPAPVIFITGYAGAEAYARIQGEVPGAALLRKPVLVVELRLAVTRALRPAS
ncbi:response regulator [Sphingomonas psychrotolerans]|uniref:Response regulatory domain-containing protein n=1 Tax=Sphingomonas psychrotolerans TaxID=1327635 RepID=A0A2K8MIY0_9SPHN|nr:response regulator [Sphingomonas psychrotolerans]ATY33813.1 hypothetical protein CVN68_19150 [Sphingomonas psychrotolerans]